MARLENFRLKVFGAVAEHLNFRKAAEQLFLTQPAVTLQIKAPARERGVRTEPFMEDELILIMPPSFDSNRLSPAQLLATNLLMREQGSGSRRVVETALEKADFKLKAFKKVMELDSTEAVKSAVEAGLGGGFVSRWAIAKELELGTLKVAEVSGVRATRHFSLI
jgi:DNA-binding transcriptional LysR family regulator